MKLTIERKALHEGLRKAQQVAERRGSIPILACARLQASTDGRLQVAATNMDQHLKISLPAEVEAPGDVCVNLDRLATFAAGAPDGSQIAVRQGKDNLNLNAGSARARIATLPSDQFPSWQDSKAKWRAGLRAGDLLTALGRTRWAESTEEIRYHLNGVYIHRHDEATLRFVATDGHRVHIAHATPDGDMEWPDQNAAILPRFAVGILPKLLAEDGAVEVTGNESRLRFAQDSVTFDTRLVEGSFPDYPRVIPAQPNTTVGVGRRELLAAVERVRPMADRKDNSVSLRFIFGRIQLAAQANDDPPSVIADAVEADVPDQPPPDISFNGGYLRQALEALEGERVTIGLSDSASPAIWRSNANTHDLCVVMPRLNAFPELPED